MTLHLRDIAASITSPVESRLFREYGASFVTTATPPPRILFDNAAQVEQFQASLSIGSARFGEHLIELQAEAINSLRVAAAELSAGGGSLTARAADAGGRSYEDTVRLWSRNVTRGLQHWEEQGRIDAARAATIRELDPVEQVAIILEIEETEHLFCGTFFNRSILYSVAAPGASQHLSLLAFDVAEYQESSVEAILENNGWFRTVVNDLPHFTFLGRRREELSELGLMRVVRPYDEVEYHFWIPDV
jgi:hypothetical protein